MSRYLLTSDDLLVFRDGRPFGDLDTFGGGSLDWPLPQTLAGMCRTAIGHQRSVDYFKDKDKANAEAVETIGLENLQSCLITGEDKSTVVEALLPTPADLVFMQEKDQPTVVTPLSFDTLGEGEGTDVAWEEWLYPTLEYKGKPTASPRFLRHGMGEAYLNGTLPSAGKTIQDREDVVTGLVRDQRIHTAIEPGTGAVKEGHLYAEAGVMLTALCPEDGNGKGGLSGYDRRIQGDIGIAFELSGLNPDEILPEWGYLGGERRRVCFTHGARNKHFEIPEFKGDQFVKLILATPGDFGGWVPSWLHSGDMKQPPEWVNEPISNVCVKLRSAVVIGWEPVSGWDYAKRGPKAFRKLVRPGAVYLLEVKNPDETGALAESLWGKSICEHQKSVRDGYGQVVLAKANI